jgi:hypothetical protein
MSDVDFKNMVREAREQLYELRNFFKDTHNWSYDEFHRHLAELLQKDFDADVSHGWVRDQCDPCSKSDPSFVKMGALLQFLEKHHPDNAARFADHGSQTEEEGQEAGAFKIPDPEDENFDAANLFAQQDELKRLRPFKDPNRGSWALATLVNRAFDKQQKAGGHIGPLVNCILTYAEFRYDVKMSHMPLHSVRSIHTKQQAKNLAIALPNALAIYNVVFDFLNNPKFPWGRDGAIEDETRVAQKAMADEAKREAKRQKKKQRPMTNAQMIRAVKGTAVKGGTLPKSA